MIKVKITDLGQYDKLELEREFNAELERIEGEIPVFSGFENGSYTKVEFAHIVSSRNGCVTLKMRLSKTSAEVRKQYLKMLAKGELKIYVTSSNKMYVILMQDGAAVHVEQDIYIASEFYTGEPVEEEALADEGVATTAVADEGHANQDHGSDGPPVPRPRRRRSPIRRTPNETRNRPYTEELNEETDEDSEDSAD